MADFVTLSCPSCGGKLEVTRDIERFACAHCGREHIVKRTGGQCLSMIGNASRPCQPVKLSKFIEYLTERCVIGACWQGRMV